MIKGLGNNPIRIQNSARACVIHAPSALIVWPDILRMITIPVCNDHIIVGAATPDELLSRDATEIVVPLAPAAVLEDLVRGRPDVVANQSLVV